MKEMTLERGLVVLVMAAILSVTGATVTAASVADDAQGATCQSVGMPWCKCGRTT